MAQRIILKLLALNCDVFMDFMPSVSPFHVFSPAVHILIKMVISIKYSIIYL
jgi:hypothetical protein